MTDDEIKALAIQLYLQAVAHEQQVMAKGQIVTDAEAEDLADIAIEYAEDFAAAWAEHKKPKRTRRSKAAVQP